MAHPHPHTRNKTERRTSNESYVCTYVCLVRMHVCMVANDKFIVGGDARAQSERYSAFRRTNFISVLLLFLRQVTDASQCSV